MGNILYKQDFNLLDDGDLWWVGGGQDLWQIYHPSSTSPHVETGAGYEGAKGLRGFYEGPNFYCTAKRPFDPVLAPDVLWFKCWFKTAIPATYYPYFYLVGTTGNKLSSMVNENKYKVYDGNGVGGGTLIDTGFTIQANVWYEMKKRLRFADNAWDVYINDMKVPLMEDLGLKWNGVDVNLLYLYFAKSIYLGNRWLDTILFTDYDPDAGPNMGMIRRRRM